MLAAVEAENRIEAARRAEERARQAHSKATQCGEEATPEPTASTSRGGQTQRGSQVEEEGTQPSPFRTAPTHTESTAGDPSPPKLTKDKEIALEEDQYKRAVGMCDSNKNHVIFLCTSSAITQLVDTICIC